MGRAGHKAWINILGKPLLWYALQCAYRVDTLDMVIVLVPPGELEHATALVNKWNPRIETALTEGGRRRQDTIRIGLDSVPPECETVVVHDAARPFASADLFAKVIEAARRTGAATAAVMPPDTVVEVDRSGEPNYLDRVSLRLIQTPQAFRAALLRDAHSRAATDGLETTDDASLVKSIGGKVELVEGEESNFKITYPSDLVRAEIILRNPAAAR